MHCAGDLKPTAREHQHKFHKLAAQIKMGLFKWLLRLLITAAFILGGAVKLMPTINEEAYHQLVKYNVF